MLALLDWLPDLSAALLTGIGAAAAGIGSLLTGIAAIRRSKREGESDVRGER
jgi:hypothetical protein